MKQRGGQADALGAWREQCRRQLQRPMRDRLRFGFCRTHRPVLDEAPYRIFDSTREYRAWCARNLPEWLGYAETRSQV